MTIRNNFVWYDPPTNTLDPTFCQNIGGHPLIAQILTRRGFCTLDTARAFLHPEYYRPTPPEDLSDVVIAAQYIEEAVESGDPILVWGDFDVDGQTATALLVDALTRLGAQVHYYIPDRLRESHGIQPDILREQLDSVRPGVLLTCDTGISAHPSIDYAKLRGIVTLITDHHDLPPSLPDADAIVNPKRLPADHPLRSLPGVGVAYKLIEYLYTQHGRAKDLVDFLDLVALGIVADVAEQTRDTRYLLQIGLNRLRDSQRIGIRALIDVAALKSEQLSATDIGFELGPRLNAAGRLGDARLSVELLTTRDAARARVLAAQLEGLNSQRRFQNRQIYAAVQEQIARDTSLLDWEGLVLGHPAWHAGIIGIVAGQLADRYQRPVVLFQTDENGLARGSARSVPGYDIAAAIAAQADMLIEHGGHPGAAGLSLYTDDIPLFRRRLSDTLREIRDPSVRPGLHIDAYLSLDEITLEFAAELERLAPYGEGNPRVILASRDLQLKSAAYVGRTHQHRRLTVEDSSGTRQQVFWWNSADHPLPEGLFDIAYEVNIGMNQGAPELQLVLVDYRRSASAPTEIVPPARQVIDYRQSQSAETLYTLLLEYPDAMVWAEGYRQSESPGLPLSKLSESSVLIVHTTPTGPQPLQEALERVKPEIVVLLGIDPPIQAFLDVQRRILELVKFVLHRQNGQTTLTALAGATGQSLETIRLALDYYTAQGEITVEYKRNDVIVISSGVGVQADDAPEMYTLLQASMNETIAYRAYFQRAAAHHLLGWDE